MTFDIGPFHLYRVNHSGTLDISLKAFPNADFGWEYGWEDFENRGQCYPTISIRFKKLNVFYFERFKKGRRSNGFELWILGFWWVY